MQHPTKRQSYSHLLLIMKTIQVRQTTHAGHCWRSKDELISEVLLWTPSHGWVKLNDQLEPIYNSSVPIQDVAWRTSQEWWMIKMSGKRGSGKSMLTAQHDNDGWFYNMSNLVGLSKAKVSLFFPSAKTLDQIPNESLVKKKNYSFQ